MTSHRIRSPRSGGELPISQLDDLAGSLEDLATLLRRIGAKGVRLRFRGDLGAISDTESPTLVKGILLAADFQARVTAARLRDDVIGARQRGLFPNGRPRTLDPARVAELRAAGLGATAIAAELGVARSSVYRKLKEIEAPETRRLRSQAASPNWRAARRA